MIVRNSNQFNGSLSTVILENINTISVLSGDNESTPSTKRALMHRTCAHATLSASYDSAES